MISHIIERIQTNKVHKPTVMPLLSGDIYWGMWGAAARLYGYLISISSCCHGKSFREAVLSHCLMVSSEYFCTLSKRQQDRQCTYNVTLRRLRVTTVAVEKNKYYIFCVFVCILRYPACNAHAPYRHQWPVRLCSIFSTLSHKRHDSHKSH